MKIRHIETIDLLKKNFDFTFDNTTEYVYIKQGNLHTDNIEYLDFTNIEELETYLRVLFREKGELELCVETLDELDYSRTLLANSSVRFTDIYEKNDIVTVFVIKNI